MAEIILANATETLSQQVHEIGTSLLSTLLATLCGIVITLIGAVATYIRNSMIARADRIEQFVEMKALKAKQIELHRENNELRKTPKSGSMSPSPSNPTA